MSHPRIWIVMLACPVQTLHWGSIQDRRSSRGRLYHCTISTVGVAWKLLTVELRTGCRFHATFLSTQVRLPPGPRNFCRPKRIPFSPLKWEGKVNVELYATHCLQLDSKWKSWAIRDLQLDSGQKRRWKWNRKVNLILHKNENGIKLRPLHARHRFAVLIHGFGLWC